MLKLYVYRVNKKAELLMTYGLVRKLNYSSLCAFSRQSWKANQNLAVKCSPTKKSIRLQRNIRPKKKKKNQALFSAQFFAIRLWNTFMWEWLRRSQLFNRYPFNKISRSLCFLATYILFETLPFLMLSVRRIRGRNVTCNPYYM